MDFEDSKFQGPTRLIWIGDPRFATLGCFILALTAVPTKKHPTEVFGWLANKAVCAMRLLHHTPKRNITSSSMVPTCKVRQIFSRGKLASFLSTGPTKVHQHPHLVGFPREILGGSQLRDVQVYPPLPTQPSHLWSSMVEGSTSPPWIFESSKKSSPGKKVVKFMVEV